MTSVNETLHVYQEAKNGKKTYASGSSFFTFTCFKCKIFKRCGSDRERILYAKLHTKIHHKGKEPLILSSNYSVEQGNVDRLVKK